MSQTKMLTELIGEVKTLMQQAGYSDRTIGRYNHCWNAFLDYSEETGQVFTSEKALDFLEKVYCITVFSDLSKSDAVRARAIQFLCEYNQYGRFSMAKISSGKVPGFHFEEYLDRFKEYQKSRHLISDTTLKHYDHELGRFLLYLTQKGYDFLKQLSVSDILDYCSSFSSFSSSVRHNAFSTLRVFLRYLFQEKLIHEELASIVPSVSNVRECKLPTAYSKKEQDDLLKAVNRSSPVGKRDYAIIMIASRFGLRSSDIRLMTFSSIHWEKNTIELCMAKTKEFIVLPLLKEVGEAVIEYIRYGRLTCELPYIFVSHLPPLRAITASGMTAIVRRYAESADIDCTPYGKGGPHALRSTLATHLLENDVPLPVISEILGHRDTRTTEVYLKLDIPHLRKCGLEVPIFDWNKNDKEVF